MIDNEILENLAEIQSGYNAKGKVIESPSGTHRLLQSNDIEGEAINWDTMLSFNPKREPDRYKIRENDILFVARGYKNKAYLAKNPPENTLASNVFYIIKPKSVDPVFLFWWLNQNKAQVFFAQFQAKMGFGYLSKKNLKKLEVPIPSKAKQQKIAAVLRLWEKEQSLISEIGFLKEKVLTSILLSATQNKER